MIKETSISNYKPPSENMICSSSSMSIANANGGRLLQQPSTSSFSGNRISEAAIRRGLRKDIDSGSRIGRTKGQAFHVVNANVTLASGKAKKEVIMVDPAEAKLLAAKQMEAIKKKQTFKRSREIEAINGAWAMLGLTTGLVLEGQTGNGILAQLAGYCAAVVNIFTR